MHIVMVRRTAGRGKGLLPGLSALPQMMRIADPPQLRLSPATPLLIV